MRVLLVCGDRNWKDEKKILRMLKKEHKKCPIDYLIEGGQKSQYEGSWGEPSWKGFYGADYLAKKSAKKLGIQTVECEALWDFHHKAAGPIRNQKQLDLACKLVDEESQYLQGHRVDEFREKQSKYLLVLAFHSDLKNSKGTKDMVNRAKKAGVHVKVIGGK